MSERWLSVVVTCVIKDLSLLAWELYLNIRDIFSNLTFYRQKYERPWPRRSFKWIPVWRLFLHNYFWFWIQTLSWDTRKGNIFRKCVPLRPPITVDTPLVTQFWHSNSNTFSLSDTLFTDQNCCTKEKFAVKSRIIWIFSYKLSLFSVRMKRKFWEIHF